MLTAKRSAGVTPKVNFAQAIKYASEGIHPGFETQGRRHQKSKPGVSVAHKNNWCPLIFF